VSQGGDRTLAGVLDDLARRGFTEHFRVVGDTIRSAPSGRTFRPEDLTIRDYVRFEGISDPDDMSIVYVIEGRDGTRGTLVDAFGVYASPAVGAALAQVPIRRIPPRGPAPSAAPRVAPERS
jgi:hypothetical protein